MFAATPGSARHVVLVVPVLVAVTPAQGSLTDEMLIAGAAWSPALVRAHAEDSRGPAGEVGEVDAVGRRAKLLVLDHFEIGQIVDTKLRQLNGNVPTISHSSSDQADGAAARRGRRLVTAVRGSSSRARASSPASCASAASGL